ncbi:carboxypeptidase-like regulatory domain-containing protein [Flavobacterium sp.]|uniref:carboxypeptidase-like regulatory domain-containing protein n=1 Tax=Flavobacterium sp. TaxID=239 RepID=UPI00262A1F59|nr:carboxypeptidase-like regulatory domain-containing protein [Flavobacterium sp.]
MNASFSILQKLKNQFFQSVSNKSDYHVAFAPFAFTLSNDDFYFLKNNIITGSEAKKYLKEQSEFSYIANSILKKPNLWTIDSDNLLYNSYKNILENALIIDPDELTAAEILKINKAKSVLFKADGNDSAKYVKYKSYVLKSFDLEKKIIDQNALKNTINPTDTASLEKWNIDYTDMANQKKELLIEWQVKGFKSAVESAKSAYDSIILAKSSFVEKWTDARNIKLSSPNLLTDEYGVEFLSTTCIPNSICDYQSPIWKKITLTKAEITQLTQTFTQEIPAEVLLEFGNLEPELESIAFEYSIIDIQRPWFDETIINNRLWKYADDNQKVSQGDDSMIGEIPAYPVKIILSKNIELVFTPNAAVNEEIKDKLKNGTRLFFGSLLLKTIPLNLANENINSYKVQQLTTNELSVITKVAVQNSPTTKIDERSKFKMMELINHQPQIMMRKNVELKSVRPVMISKMSAVSIAKPIVVAEARTVAPVATPIRVRPMVIRPIDISVIRMETVPTPTPTPPTPTSTIATIKGKIFDNTNQPISVVEVQIMNNANASTQSVLTLEDGTFSIDNIEKGSYQIKIKKTGFITQERKLDVVGDTRLDLLLEVQPVPTETFQVMGVICKKLPKLPNPNPESIYI